MPGCVPWINPNSGIKAVFLGHELTSFYCNQNLVRKIFAYCSKILKPMDICASTSRACTPTIHTGILVRMLSNEITLPPEQSADQSANASTQPSQPLQQTPRVTRNENKTQGVIAHLAFWLFNGIFLLWLSSVITTNQGLLANLLSFVPKIFTQFEPVGLLGLKAFLLIALAPLLGVAAYLVQIFQRTATSSKIWGIIVSGQLLLVVIAFIVFSASQEPMNLGGLITLSVLILFPLQNLALLILPKKLLQNKTALITTLAIVTITLVAISYFAILLSFFVPLIISQLIEAILFSGGSMTLAEVMRIIFITLSAILGLFVFIIPYLSTITMIKRFRKLYQRSTKQLPRYLPLGVSLGSVATLLVVILIGAQPIKTQYIHQLDEFALARTFAEQKAVVSELKQSERQVEKEYLQLTQIYRAYPLGRGVNDLARQYESELSAPPALAQGINNVFFTLAFPFTEPDNLEITNAQNRSVIEQRRAAFYIIFGYYPGSSESELSHVIDETDQVNLVRRNISAQTDLTNRLARVTIEEEYVNTTNWEQEIVYVFTLPESAAISDLKLGPNLEFQGQIAPRGAAEQVFNEQVRLLRDPALIEQVGPGQYRLRVFPIPPRNQEGENLRVSFSYLTLLEPDGFALPQYSLEENITTQFADKPQPMLDDLPVLRAMSETYLKNSDTTDYCQSILQPIRINAGELTPSDAGKNICQSRVSGQGMPIVNQRIALLVDVSARPEEKVIRAELQSFFSEQQQLLAQNQVDVVEINTAGQQVEQLSVQNWQSWLDELVFFGEREYNQLFSAVPADYNLVILIGNNHQGSLIAQADQVLAPINAPFHWVFLDGAPQALPQDVLYHLYRHRVQVHTQLDEVLAQHNTAALSDPSQISFGTYWDYTVTGQQHRPASTQFTRLSNMNKLITAALIKEWVAYAELHQPLADAKERTPLAENMIDQQDGLAQSGFENQLSLLDYLHEHAKTMGIVTPYSSYIALVNAEQQERLDELSLRDDRFEERAGGNASMGVFQGRRMELSAGQGWASPSLDSISGSPSPVGFSTTSADGSFNPLGSTTAAFSTLGLSLLGAFGLFVGGSVWWLRRRHQQQK